MGGKIREACGRCSMTSVVDMFDGDGGRNPFDGPRIEIPEEEMRRVAKPQILLGRAKRKLDEIATRLTYGEVR